MNKKDYEKNKDKLDDLDYIAFALYEEEAEKIWEKELSIPEWVFEPEIDSLWAKTKFFFWFFLMGGRAVTERIVWLARGLSLPMIMHHEEERSD